ncbi:hypothetical protein LJC64_03810, partial [Ruminococcaceae bacterium OttesenSCG-928-A11]|nr:hypothetical protein [Ruminococcaceae bacterium OttesenSCG-928-A11]
GLGEEYLISSADVGLETTQPLPVLTANGMVTEQPVETTPAAEPVEYDAEEIEHWPEPQFPPVDAVPLQSAEEEAPDVPGTPDEPSQPEAPPAAEAPELPDEELETAAQEPELPEEEPVPTAPEPELPEGEAEPAVQELEANPAEVPEAAEPPVIEAVQPQWKTLSGSADDAETPAAEEEPRSAEPAIPDEPVQAVANELEPQPAEPDVPALADEPAEANTTAIEAPPDEPVQPEAAEPEAQPEAVEPKSAEPPAAAPEAEEPIPIESTESMAEEPAPVAAQAEPMSEPNAPSEPDIPEVTTETVSNPPELPETDKTKPDPYSVESISDALEAELTLREVLREVLPPKKPLAPGEDPRAPAKLGSWDPARPLPVIDDEISQILSEISASKRQGAPPAPGLVAPAAPPVAAAVTPPPPPKPAAKPHKTPEAAPQTLWEGGLEALRDKHFDDIEDFDISVLLTGKPMSSERILPDADKAEQDTLQQQVEAGLVQHPLAEGKSASAGGRGTEVWNAKYNTWQDYKAPMWPSAPGKWEKAPSVPKVDGEDDKPE